MVLLLRATNSAQRVTTNSPIDSVSMNSIVSVIFSDSIHSNGSFAFFQWSTWIDKSAIAATKCVRRVGRDDGERNCADDS